jgi:predicted N-acetyltransferase YhbS
MVARCNDVAFGVPAPLTLADAFASVDDDAIVAHVALRDGELACGVLVTHVERNLYTWGLAGTPAARGSIVAVRLMRTVLRDARDRGCETVTCETTPAAQTIAGYFRMRPLGRLALWERRAGQPPGPGSAGA